MRPTFDLTNTMVITDYGFIPPAADGHGGRLLGRALAENDMEQPDPYSAAPPPKTFLARDLIDLLTVDDLTAIETAVQSSAALRLLWLRLRTREGKPVAVEGDAFTQGWAGLSGALGATRASEIAEVLGIPN